MRILLALLLAVVPAAAQGPVVQLRNASRPGSDFQTGDRFEIAIAAVPGQRVSVRTYRQGRTDWGPAAGSTDSAGRWSTSGQFDTRDFGSWKEIWTVGDKLASPVIQFAVSAPCLPGGRGQAFLFASGPNTVLNCETSGGPRTFATPSLSDSFRTPDGRLVNGRADNQTQRQYYGERLGELLDTGMGATSVVLQSSRGGLGDETAELIGELIGVNALSEVETRNALAIVRAAFGKPDNIQPAAKEPAKTLLLLRHLDAITAPGGLKRDIDETIAYFEAR